MYASGMRIDSGLRIIINDVRLRMDIAQQHPMQLQSVCIRLKVSIGGL